MIFENNCGGEYGKYFVQELHEPAQVAQNPEFARIYSKFAKRIIWMDGDVVPGAFQMNTAWYHSVPERDPIFTEHVHDDSCELIGFFSSDKENPYDLGGEIEFTLGGETHRLTKSTMIFVPKGVPHNPMRIKRVDRPIFHFSVVMTERYDGTDVYK